MSVLSSEQLPSIAEWFAEWREEYKEGAESFEFLAGSGGGS
jgi:hypothetical protein